jgi:beta-galactosidase
LAYITVQVVDENGVRVPHAGNSIHFDIQGPGTNAGVSNSNLLSDELWQAEDRSAYEGRALLVVRADRQPGRIDVRATSSGLEAATLSIQTVEWESSEGE